MQNIRPALYGFAAYETLQSAPDWGTEGEGYRWFIDYYLDKMKRLLMKKERDFWTYLTYTGIRKPGRR